MGGVHIGDFVQKILTDSGDAMMLLGDFLDQFSSIIRAFDLVLELFLEFGYTSLKLFDRGW